MEQFEVLKKYFAGLISIPPLEWMHFVSLLKIQKLEKDQCYFREGEPVSEISFVVKGLLFNYYTDEGGTEFVKYFIDRGGLVACYSSLLQNKPAAFTCKTIEPTTLITLKFEDLQKLYKRHSCWERVGRVSAERLYIEKEYREQHFLRSDAKKRYELFLKDNAEIAERIPQYLIASYIGISPVSLSRIRAERV